MLLHIFFNTIVFVSTLGILIIVHECGHFLVARFFEVKVERFSIGFGPVLWSKKDSNGTEYTISAILLGGYVKLMDTAIQKTNQYCDFNNSFYHKCFWKKSLIIIAGPMFNFVFSILLYVIVFVLGVSSYKPIINYIIPNSIIEQSDLSIGSRIQSINAVQVDDWESVRLQILNHINKTKIIISTEVVDNDNIISKQNIIYLPVNWFYQSDLNFKDPITALGILPNFLYVSSVISEKRLYFFNQQDHLKINDKILLINGQSIYNWKSFIQIIKDNLNKKFSMVIERDKNILKLDCSLIENCFINSTDFQKNINLFSDTVVMKSVLTLENHRYGLYEAISKSFNKVWNYMCFIMCTLLKLITGDIKIINLHGPIAIAKIAGQTIQHGIVYYFIFLAIISINLGVINLLPFPILDGGQLLLLLIEKIQGYSILPKTRNFIYMISVIILVIIIFITVYNDINL